MKLNLVKKAILFFALAFSTLTFACTPPIENPTAWDYYTGANSIFIGTVYNSNQIDGSIVSSVTVNSVIKNTKNNLVVNERIDVVSKGSSNLCGYINPFFRNNVLLVFGNVDANADIEIKTYGGTREFPDLASADSYYVQNYVNDPFECKQIYTGYVYEEEINQCIEASKTGCEASFSEVFLESKLECDEKYVKFEAAEVTCNDDIKVCRDGTELSRVPPFCGFEDCPVFEEPRIIEEVERVVCTTDIKQCSDGSWVSRLSPSCEFEECPVGEPDLCNNDQKRCPDGSYVGRVAPHCSFDNCQLDKQTSKNELSDEKKCDAIFSGYKFNEQEGYCYQTNIQACENSLFENKDSCELENGVVKDAIADDYTSCSLDYNPVCGIVLTEESTYVNECLMKEAGADLVKYGDCNNQEGIIKRVINWFKNLFS